MKDRNDPRARFRQHRADAKKRGVAWKLTFDQWWNVWLKSGRWEQRGPRKGQYCMSRPGDLGIYEIGNVRIVTVTTNIGERKHSPEGLKRMSRRGTRLSTEHKKKIGLASKKAWKARPRAGTFHGPHSEATKERMRAAARAVWKRRKSKVHTKDYRVIK